MEANIIDLFCDLCHLADREGLDWEELLRIGLGHYTTNLTYDGGDDGQDSANSN